MSMVYDIPKFWINLNGLVQSSNLYSVESTITRVFCMQGALKFHYWLQDIIPAAIQRISKPNHQPKIWIDKLVTDIQSSIRKGHQTTFQSSHYLPNLPFPSVYKMTPPQLFKFDLSDQLTTIVSSTIRLWLRFPTEEDFLAQVMLVDIITTNSLPSVLFLDKIWEMYKKPFSTVFNNNWDIRRSKTKLIQGLADFKKEFASHPFAITNSSSRSKLDLLSELILKWMKFSGADSNMAEVVS